MYLVNIRSTRAERAGGVPLVGSPETARTEAGPGSRALSSEVDMIRRLFPFWGAEEEGEEEGGEGTDPQTPPEPTTKNLTAEEIEKMTARAADRSARKAKKDLASELGFDSVEAFKEWAASQREAEKLAMDEQTRAIEEAKQAKAEAEALRNNLASDRLELAIQRQVLSEGISKKEKVSRITALVQLELDPDLVNDEEGWEEAITGALTAVKEDVPELFAESAPGGHGSGDGGARGPSAKPEDKEAETRKKLEEEFAARGLVPYDA